MNDIIDFALKHIIQIVIAGILGLIAIQLKTMIAGLKNDREEHKQIKDTMIVLLKDRLYQACNHHLDKGYCTTDDRTILQAMYDDYSEDYKQNGVVKDLYFKVLKLPLRKEGKK